MHFNLPWRQPLSASTLSPSMQRSAVKPEAHTQCLALLCSGGANLVYRQQVVTASTCYTNCVRFTALSSSPFLLLVLIDLILLLLQFVIIIAVLLLYYSSCSCYCLCYYCYCCSCDLPSLCAKRDYQFLMLVTFLSSESNCSYSTCHATLDPKYLWRTNRRRPCEDPLRDCD